MWMDLELVIQSKASQKERESKCHILTQIYMESRKRVQINLFAGRNREQMHGLQWGEGEGGMNWEIGIDSIIYKINN